MTLPSDKASKPTSAELRELAKTHRRWIIEQSFASKVGHIGSALSIVDIMVALWHGVMHDPGSESPARDRFVLGKGHASLALYCALRSTGRMDAATFATYCGEDSLLGVHPEHGLAGVDASTGSLGQGLSMACGQALGLRVASGSTQGDETPRVFSVLSDAECNEGQVWEAVMFAAHHHLANLIVVVDENGLQAMGHTRDVLDLSPSQAKWSAFGWEASYIDGHDVAALADALALARSQPDPRGRPRVFLARTVLGKGVSFMEDRLEWHYRNIDAEQARVALSDLSRT